AQSPQLLSDIGFHGPDGEELSIASLSDKLLLVNLWATWCVPCRTEMPALDELQRELGSDRFEVVAINIDRGTDEKPKTFLAETGIDSLAYYRDNTLAGFDNLKRRGLALGL